MKRFITLIAISLLAISAISFGYSHETRVPSTEITESWDIPHEELVAIAIDYLKASGERVPEGKISAFYRDCASFSYPISMGCEEVFRVRITYEPYGE